jgi:hypothetical protein
MQLVIVKVKILDKQLLNLKLNGLDLWLQL